MPNNLKNSEGNIIKTSWNIQFTKINSRRKFEENIYKKITKKDFVMAFVFSFAFVFTFFSVQNWNQFKADLFDVEEEEIIYDWEESRTFSPSLSFYPENKIIENWTRQEWKNTYLDYYTLKTPDNIVEISLDNITSTPTCPYWWKYKFQWTTQYLKLWENINESDISLYWTNHPILSNQNWINANYKIDSTWTWITIFFDKDIKNWKYYDFALKDWITIYKNYKTLEKFIPEDLIVYIKWNKLNLKFSNKFETDFWRIIISKNLISDLDWRINNEISIIWKKIWNEFVIDNKKPIPETPLYLNNLITIIFDENINENPDKNIENNISIWWKILSEIDSYNEYDINQNELKIFFSTWSTLSGLTIWTWAVVDKLGNENNYLEF